MLYTSPFGRPIQSNTNPTTLWCIQLHCYILHEDYSPTFPQQSIARYSFIQLSELGHRGENKTQKLRNNNKGIRIQALSIKSLVFYHWGWLGYCATQRQRYYSIACVVCSIHLQTALCNIIIRIEVTRTFWEHIRDSPNWYQMWNSSNENFIARSNVWNSEQNNKVQLTVERVQV